MFIIRNYNRFLIGPTHRPRWDDFYIHRFVEDFKKLLKFETKQEAIEFVQDHPEIEVEFDAWIQETNQDEWN